MNLRRPPIILDIVEEHFDELDFLWELREGNVFSPDWTLDDLGAQENRAEAHLDGLRGAELHSVDLAAERIKGTETFMATAAALVLFETGVSEYHHLILEALRSADRPTVEGIRFALRHVDSRPLFDGLGRLLEEGEEYRAAAAADVLAFHGSPVDGLEILLSSDEPEVRILALGAAARLGKAFPREIAAAVEAPDPLVRRAALEAAVRLDVPGLQRHCRAAAARETDPDPVAVSFLGVLGDPADLELLQSLLGRNDVANQAVNALGAMGSVTAIPWLLELMEGGSLAGPAASAYRRITGAEGLEPADPETGDSETEDSPEEEAGEPLGQAPEEMAEEEDTLPPDPEKARADWKGREGQMGPDRLWQGGFPTPTDLFPVEDMNFSLEARRDLFLRLRAKGGSTVPTVELEALVRRQLSNGSGR